MIRISKLSDYGAMIMMYLTHSNQSWVSARDIARDTHLKIPTVSKLLKRLTSEGLLESSRGAQGGYRLQREPGAISIADIINALEDKKGLVECTSHHSTCSLQDVCGVRTNWRMISDVVENALSTVTLQHLIQKSGRPPLSDGQVTHVAFDEMLHSQLSRGMV